MVAATKAPTSFAGHSTANKPDLGRRPAVLAYPIVPPSRRAHTAAGQVVAGEVAVGTLVTPPLLLASMVKLNSDRTAGKGAMTQSDAETGPLALQHLNAKEPKRLTRFNHLRENG